MSQGRRLLALVLLAGVFVMDGFDLNAMPLAVPHLQRELGLSPAQFGIAFSAVLVGLGGGAALIAPLGDRIGRKPLIVFSCLAAALTTFATASSGSIAEFALWRLLTGASLGACLPNCTALSAELASENKRATVMTLVSAGIPLGAMGAGLTAPEVVALGGWAGLFLTPGILAVLLALALWAVLPAQSARPAPPAGAPRSKAPQLELLRSPWNLPFAIMAAALTLNALNLYLLSQWMPSVLPDAGFTLDQAARISGLVQGAGFAMGLSASVLIDRWKPGPTMVGLFAIVAASFLAIGLIGPAPAAWTVLLLIGVGGSAGAAMAIPALTPALFPRQLLSSAIGMGVLIARIGAISGPMVGSAMLAAGTGPSMFLMAAALPAALCALICLGLPAALAVKRAQPAGEEITA